MNSSEIIGAVLNEVEIKAAPFAKKIGVVPTQIYDLQSGKIKKISETIVEKIIKVYPRFNKVWLLTGEGKMLNDSKPVAATQADGGTSIPFYEHTIMCGSPADFDACIEANKADSRIALPNLTGDFALVARGESMVDAQHPDRSILPGSIVVLRKVADRSLLQWGEIYAIATADGFIIKKIMPLDSDGDRIECRSLNAAEFPPFAVPKSDIYGFARVIAVISYKLY